MALIVQKFGGSSVATPDKIKHVARRILQSKGLLNRMVVVVSAMGDTTDDLIELAHQVAPNAYGREMDMLLSSGEQVSIALLAMALKEMGQPAVSLTGRLAGIMTNDVYNKGKIIGIDGKRIQQELAQDQVVVVAGFQGVNPAGEVMTLGRGGSDTTAVALAAALKADVCEIFTDVEGVYTADPREVPHARKLNQVSYDEMLEMARLGAVVLHPRAVEVAMHYGVKIHVRSTFSDAQGTIIKEECDVEKEIIIRGVSHDNNVAKIAVLGVPDQPGIAYKIFSALAEETIDVDMIVQSVRDMASNINDIVFTVKQEDLFRARQIVEQVGKSIGGFGVVCDDDVAKVSIIGAGMVSNPGIAATMFGALQEAGANIEIISTSEISVSCLIRANRAKEAVRAIHDAFHLRKQVK